MSIETEKFITEILNRPAIWMPKHPHHKLRHVVKRMWGEMRDIFPGFSVEQIKRKWKNLKDNYRRELKKTSTSRSGDPGTGDDTSPQWKHFNQMSFLKDDMMPVEGDSNLMENEDEELDVSVSSEVQSPPSFLASPRAENVSPIPSRSQSPSPRSVSPLRSTQTDTPLPSRKRTKANDIRIEYLEIEKKKLKILEDEMAKNKTTHQNTPNIEQTDDYFYLMSILPEMQKLNPIQKMRLRNKINQALMEEMVMSEDPYSHRSYYTQPTSSFTTFNRNEYNDRNRNKTMKNRMNRKVKIITNYNYKGM